MKPKSLMLMLVALCASTFTFAQGFHIGAKAGANIFKIDGQSFKEGYEFGYNVGAFAEIDFSQRLGIQPEVLWSQTNYRSGDQFNDLYPGGVDDVKGKLNYLSIPVLLTYRAAPFLSLQAGPQFGILLNDDKSLFQNGREAFKSGDFSMLGGVQLNFGSAKIGGRYVVGLSNINDIDNKDKWKNQGFQVYLGLRII
ncbi:MAG: porin family protein [Candidatus Pseudobacter hemicellulosilyticus]|uniref:Porin family protein n=1 Tax=Candidatus Pseudobacter hemicellulosilyticus TaxID=3121375 RepID=A0AAJ5WX66_9BACT|nr:MAG: porin family protein [Pseudobacter sp.]